MAPLPIMGPGMRRRRMLFRRRRRGRRAIKRRGRRAGRRTRGVGPYQKKFGGRFFRKLDLNFARNDYDSTREIKSVGSQVASNAASFVTQHYCYVGDFPLALSKLFDYDEYKVTKLQMVIQPQFLHKGSTQVEAATNYDPFFYVVPRIHVEAWTGTPSIDEVRNTPGVIKVPFNIQKPVVINLAVWAEQTDTIVRDLTGASLTIRRPMTKLNWMHNPQTSGPFVSANYASLGNVNIYWSQLAAGSYLPRFEIKYVATFLFRGNRVGQLDV